MSVFPLVEIDRQRAVEDLFTLRIAVNGESRLFLARDSYCINPKCDCADARVRLIDLGEGSNTRRIRPGDLISLLEAREKSTLEGFQLDVELGDPPRLKVDKSFLQVNDGPEIFASLKKEMPQGFLAILKEHKAFVGEWRKENWWRFEDWTEFDTEPMVAFATVYPSVQMVEIVSLGRRYLVDDHYCLRPGCECGGIQLIFLEVNEEPDSDGTVHAPLFGRIQLSLEKSKLRLAETKEGDPARMESLMGALLESRPGYPKLLLRRRRLLGEFMPFVEKQKAAKRARELKRQLRSEPYLDLQVQGVGASRMLEIAKALAPAAPQRAALVGARGTSRNAPCPCGSGRKYKNCCGRS